MVLRLSVDRAKFTHAMTGQNLSSHGSGAASAIIGIVLLTAPVERMEDVPVND